MENLTVGGKVGWKEKMVGEMAAWSASFLAAMSVVLKASRMDNNTAALTADLLVDLLVFQTVWKLVGAKVVNMVASLGIF